MPDLPLWTDCNQACAFCSNPGGGYRALRRGYSLEDLAAKLKRHKDGLRRVFLKFDERTDYFTLTGGEPTLHPKFFEALAMIKGEFPEREIRLLSNGRSLASERFAARLLETASAPFEAGILFCGPDAATHERIAGAAPGAFEQTVRGVENLLRLKRDGQKVELRVILTALQMPVLRATLNFLKLRFPGADRTTLIFFEMEGRSLRRSDELALSMSGCARELDALYSILHEFKELRLYHLPLCVLTPRLRPFAWKSLDPFKVVYKLECRDCALRPGCVGVHKAYAQKTGAKDIAPPVEAVSWS